MTVGENGEGEGTLSNVVKEKVGDSSSEIECVNQIGVIHADFTTGPNLTSARSLKANGLISSTGLILGSRGFLMTRKERDELISQNPQSACLVYPIKNGRDLLDMPRDMYVIDTHSLDIGELKARHPVVFQRLLTRVYPERQTNRDTKLRSQWWLFRRTNEQVRKAIHGLARYIVTSETSRRRIFMFLDGTAKPEHKLVVIGSDSAYILAVLSSRIHVVWSMASGGWLGVGNDSVYAKSTCFEKFPFPDGTGTRRTLIGELGEQLDAHRKRQRARQEKLTITDMYGVLDKLRSGETLSGKDRLVHEQGLVSVLQQIHDEIDAAVFDAYGWPHDLSDDEILRRLVELNHERAAEEKRGVIRWLRPEYQNPQGRQAAAASQGALPIEPGEPESPAIKGVKRPWPKTLPEQAQAVRAVLAEQSTRLDPRATGPALPPCPHQARIRALADAGLAGSSAGAGRWRLRSDLATVPGCSAQRGANGSQTGLCVSSHASRQRPRHYRVVMKHCRMRGFAIHSPPRRHSLQASKPVNPLASHFRFGAKQRGRMPRGCAVSQQPHRCQRSRHHLCPFHDRGPLAVILAFESAVSFEMS